MDLKEAGSGLGSYIPLVVEKEEDPSREMIDLAIGHLNKYKEHRKLQSLYWALDIIEVVREKVSSYD